MKKGFTLVELLIVVLIIGILSAVALPQYQKAVEKTRYAGMMPMAASVKTAQEAFYLADSSYSPSLEYLDVRVPGEVSGGSATLKDGTHVQVNADGQHDYVKMSHDALDNAYVLYFNKSANYPGEVHCEALSSSERAKSLCKNMGGEELGNGTTSGYTAYILSGIGAGSSTTTPSTPTPTPEPTPTPTPTPEPEPEPTPEPTPSPEPEPEPTPEPTPSTPSGTLTRNDLSGDFVNRFRDPLSDDKLSNLSDDEVEIVNENKISVKDAGGDVRYTATWDPENYKITYDSPDGSYTEKYYNSSNNSTKCSKFYDADGNLQYSLGSC